MTSSFLPASNNKLDDWAINFADKATQFAEEIPLTSTEIKAIETAQQEFNATIIAHVQAIRAARSARIAKLVARRKLTDLASSYNARIQADTRTSDEVKTTLGLTVRKKPMPVTPLTPTKVTATIGESGIHIVRWQSGGNKRGTVYHIEALIGNASEWVIVGSVSATRFNHTGQIPGVRILYRIVARRRNEFSSPSSYAVVYPGVGAGATQNTKKAA